MTALTSVFDAPAATALAWTLLHFLWQGAAIAAAFFFVSRYGGMAPSARYTAGVLALAVMLVAPIATYLVVLSNSAPPKAAATMPTDAAPAVTAASDGEALTDPGLQARNSATPPAWSMTAVVVGAWALGVCIFAARLAGGWMLTRRLVRDALQPVGADIQSLAVRVAARLGVDRMVHVAQSSAVAVPVMVGWLTPVVLFPASVLSGLTPKQIEALLAHELAHVRRHDYLVNLLQSVLETLLFYHPAVWWVSGRVRIEREHCCDDLTIGVCDRLVYATALSDLAALTAPGRPALAATGGSLLERVRRIVEASDPAHHAGSAWLPVLALLLLAGTVVPIALASASPQGSSAQAGTVTGRATGSADHRQGGVTGGVTGGVPGGVSGGVTGGVAAGVAPGVGGGVAEGVTGGVTRGVAGGVTGAVAAALKGQPVAGGADIQTADAARKEQQQRELAAKMEALERDARRRMEEFQKAMQALELDRLDSRTKLHLDQLSSALEVLKKQQAEIKPKVDMGLLNETELARVESRMRGLQQQIESAMTERTLGAKEIELRAAEARQQAEFSRAMEQYEAMKRQYEFQYEGMKRQYEKQAAERDRAAAGAALMRDTIQVGEGERVRAGDVLVIEIPGEPDVPRAYSVRQDGTIKLPLSAPLRVEDRTVPEVREDLVKQLTARGLERPVVNVTLRRHRASK